MKILIAAAGSPHSRLAVAYAGNLAVQLKAEVTMLCVADGRGVHEDCQEVFKSMAPIMAPLGEYRALVRHGQPAEEILRETEEESYDLLVLGEKGHHTPMTRFLIGATAERVASRARMPMLVVKGDPDEGADVSVTSILLSVALPRQLTDLDRVLRRVSHIAVGTGASVTVLHVVSGMPISPAGEPGAWPATAQEEVERGTQEGRTLEYATRRLEEAGVTVEGLVRRGLVVEEVLEEASSGRYQLLVIGGHAPGSWLQNLVLENLALQILHRCRVSVLTVHG